MVAIQIYTNALLVVPHCKMLQILYVDLSTFECVKMTYMKIHKIGDKQSSNWDFRPTDFEVQCPTDHIFCLLELIIFLIRSAPAELSSLLEWLHTMIDGWS